MQLGECFSPVYGLNKDPVEYPQLPIMTKLGFPTTDKTPEHPAYQRHKCEFFLGKIFQASLEKCF